MNPAEEALQLLFVRKEVLFLLVGCCDSAGGRRRAFCVVDFVHAENENGDAL